jgi:hypothetical protein
MLWIYAENDSYFGPELTKRMHNAFTAAGGDAEYHLLPAFGNDGHFHDRFGRCGAVMGTAGKPVS